MTSIKLGARTTTIQKNRTGRERHGPTRTCCCALTLLVDAWKNVAIDRRFFFGPYTRALEL